MKQRKTYFASTFQIILDILLILLMLLLVQIGMMFLKRVLLSNTSDFMATYMNYATMLVNKAIRIINGMVIIGVVILNFTYKNKNEETKTKKRKQNNLAIMIKGDSGEYVSSNEIPKGNYVLNEEKTICENGGKVVSYNNSTGQIGFSFLGSDRCSLYFDKIIDTQKPVISNLKINGKTITATLTDNQSLLSYGFSTSNTLEPTSWTTISGKTYNLSTTITTEGTYYLWVKDGAENKTTKEFTISLEIPITTLRSIRQIS